MKITFSTITIFLFLAGCSSQNILIKNNTPLLQKEIVIDNDLINLKKIKIKTANNGSLNNSISPNFSEYKFFGSDFKLLEVWIRNSPEALARIKKARRLQSFTDENKLWLPLLPAAAAGGYYLFEEDKVGKAALVCLGIAAVTVPPYFYFINKSIKDNIIKSVKIYNNDLRNGKLKGENQESFTIILKAYFTGYDVLQEISLKAIHSQDSLSMKILEPLFKRTGTRKGRELFRELNPGKLNSLFKISSIIKKKNYNLNNSDLNDISLKLDNICKSDLELLKSVNYKFFESYFKYLIPLDSVFVKYGSKVENKNFTISVLETKLRLTNIWQEIGFNYSLRGATTETIIYAMKKGAISNLFNGQTKISYVMKEWLNYLILDLDNINDVKLKKRYWKAFYRILLNSKQLEMSAINYNSIKEILNKKAKLENNSEVKKFAIELISKI